MRLFGIADGSITRDDRPFFGFFGTFTGAAGYAGARLEMISGEFPPLPIFRGNVQEWITETNRQIETHMRMVSDDLRQIYDALN